MVSQYADASTLMGDTQVDAQSINDLARGEYRNVQEKLQRDYVQMYHPDGTTSVVQLPPLGKGGKNLGDRQRKLMHYVLNKKKDGKQWWYASPPPGWQASATPWKCPVEGCTRAGGLRDLLNLWRHIKSKHPGEVELYQPVLKAIQDRLQQATAVNLDSLFNGGGNDGEQPLVSAEDLEAAKFEDAANIIEALPESGVDPQTFAGCAYCTEWEPKANWTEKQTNTYRNLHVQAAHKIMLEDADAPAVVNED